MGSGLHGQEHPRFELEGLGLEAHATELKKVAADGWSRGWENDQRNGPLYRLLFH